MKFIFLTFGLFELMMGYGQLSTNASELDLGQAGYQFVQAFGLAITVIGIISVFGVVIKEKIAKIALSTGFFIYNTVTAYGCLVVLSASGDFVLPGIIHTLFATAFGINLIRLIRASISIKTT